MTNADSGRADSGRADSDRADSDHAAAIWSRRVQYESAGIDIADVADDPFTQFASWYAHAEQAGCVEPNAMVLSTVDASGAPDSRYVLVRGGDQQGFDFYTNLESTKGRQIASNPAASGLFSWLQLHRQMRVRGVIERLSDAESDRYFASRPRESQLGAWASAQSTVLADRAELEERIEQARRRFVDRDVARPPYWGGLRLRPSEFEFWQGRPSRLHDRIRFRWLADSWVAERLSP